MIELRSASRWYGQVIGLNDVTCTIGPGLTALLGMNGAGKSTMMKLITGQLRPTTGEVLVAGLDPFANPEAFRNIGYCPEFDNLYERMSGRAFVIHFARLSGYGAAEAKSRAERVLETVRMADRADRAIAGYSKGMRQRIKLAQAMVHDPKVILLDEPLNGLDPLGRHEMIQLLGALADEGRTVVVSSHILYEVEQMTRSLVLLNRGRLLATGNIRAIRELIDKHPHQVRFETDDPRGAAAVFAEMPMVLSLRVEEREHVVQLEIQSPDAFYEAVADLVLAQRLRIRSFSSPDNNLESVFQYLVS